MSARRTTKRSRIIESPSDSESELTQPGPSTPLKPSQTIPSTSPLTPMVESLLPAEGIKVAEVFNRPEEGDKTGLEESEPTKRGKSVKGKGKGKAVPPNEGSSAGAESRSVSPAKGGTKIRLSIPTSESATTSTIPSPEKQPSPVKKGRPKKAAPPSPPPHAVDNPDLCAASPSSSELSAIDSPPPIPTALKAEKSKGFKVKLKVKPPLNKEVPTTEDITPKGKAAKRKSESEEGSKKKAKAALDMGESVGGKKGKGKGKKKVDADYSSSPEPSGGEDNVTPENQQLPSQSTLSNSKDGKSKGKRKESGETVEEIKLDDEVKASKADKGKSNKSANENELVPATTTTDDAPPEAAPKPKKRKFEKDSSSSVTTPQPETKIPKLKALKPDASAPSTPSTHLPNPTSSTDDNLTPTTKPDDDKLKLPFAKKSVKPRQSTSLDDTTKPSTPVPPAGQVDKLSKIEGKPKVDTPPTTAAGKMLLQSQTQSQIQTSGGTKKRPPPAKPTPAPAKKSVVGDMLAKLKTKGEEVSTPTSKNKEKEQLKPKKPPGAWSETWAMSEEQVKQFADSAPQRELEARRRAEWKVNPVNLQEAKDAYRLDSTHERTIIVPEHHGILTKGLASKMVATILQS